MLVMRRPENDRARVGKASEKQMRAVSQSHRSVAAVYDRRTFFPAAISSDGHRPPLQTSRMIDEFPGDFEFDRQMRRERFDAESFGRVMTAD